MAADPAKGSTTYTMFCAGCHGADGTHPTAPDLSNSDFLSITSKATLKAMIETGRPGRPMPGWKGILTDAQINDVVAHVKTWQKDPDVKLSAVKSRGDAKTGKQLFSTTCAGCHGNAGSGGSAPALDNPGLLKVVSDDYLRKTLEIGRPGTAMRSFQGPSGLANLDDQEIDHVVAYIRSLAKK